MIQGGDPGLLESPRPAAEQTTPKQADQLKAPKAAAAAAGCASNSNSNVAHGVGLHTGLAASKPALQKNSKVPVDPLWENFTNKGQIITFRCSSLSARQACMSGLAAQLQQPLPGGAAPCEHQQQGYQEQQGVLLKFEVLGVFNSRCKGELHHLRLLHDVPEGPAAAGGTNTAAMDGSISRSTGLVYRKGQEFALKVGKHPTHHLSSRRSQTSS